MRRSSLVLVLVCVLLVGGAGVARGAVTDIEAGAPKLVNTSGGGTLWDEEWVNGFTVPLRAVDASGNTALSDSDLRSRITIEYGAGCGLYSRPWEFPEQYAFGVSAKSADATFTYDDGVLNLREPIHFHRYPDVSIPAVGATQYLREPCVVSGQIKPRHTPGSKPVTLRFYRKSGASWVLQQSVAVAVTDYDPDGMGYVASRYRYSATLPVGYYKVSAIHGEDEVHFARVSGVRYVTVRPARTATKLALAQSRTSVTYRNPAYFTATLRKATYPYAVLPNQTIYVYRSLDPDSEEPGVSRILTLKTNSKGQVKFAGKVFGKARYQVGFPGTTTLKPSASGYRYTTSKTVFNSGSLEAFRQTFSLAVTGSYEARCIGIRMEVMILDTQDQLYHWYNLCEDYPGLVRKPLYLHRGSVYVKGVSWYPESPEYADEVRVIIW